MPHDLLQGTLDVMILRTLERAENHGYGIARAIEAAAAGHLSIEEGSLYPALYRLDKRGHIAGSWRTTEGGRRARYYRLTPRGRKQLATELTIWERLSSAVTRVLESA